MKMSMIAAAVVACVAFAGPAAAYTVGGADVGDADTLTNWAKIGSGEPTEKAWLDGILGAGTYTYTKTTDISGWTSTDQNSEVLANYLGAGAEDWFMIKTGSEGIYDHFLYHNGDLESWAVFDLGYLYDFAGLNGDFSITKISHWAAGPGSEVPLPGAAWLFGSALLGFMAVANRRRV